MTNSFFIQKFFERQLYHFLFGSLLILGVFQASTYPIVRSGHWLGISSVTWLWLTVIGAIVHQIYAWVCWRLELYKNKLTDRLDDNAFSVFSIFFALFGISRLLIIPLAIANHGSLTIAFPVRWGISGIFFLLSAYTFYSIARFFTFSKAFGLDHFNPEEARTWSLVESGIFRFTSNGMYIFGFLILWAVAIFLESAGAMVCAAFQHAYIWVHYFCTERPDMEYIYDV